MVSSRPVAQTPSTPSATQTVTMDTSILDLNQVAMNQISPKPDAPLPRGSVRASSSQSPPHSPENRALREQALQYDQSSMRKYLSNTDMR